MFAQSGHAPRGTVIERNEIRHQVRRLSSHACLFLWSGCNECTDLSIYVDLLGVIAEEDSPKAIWPASPSNGWVSGVARLWATPDGTPLEARDPGTIEAHGPYIRGGGFPAVNGVTNYEPVATDVRFRRGARRAKSSVDLRLRIRRRGLVLSRILASTLSPRYRSLFGNQPPDVCEGDGFPNVCRGGNILARRNYPCANFVGSFLGGRRTTCGPVAHHPRWWRTSTTHKTSLHHCTCAASPAPYLSRTWSRPTARATSSATSSGN